MRLALTGPMPFTEMASVGPSPVFASSDADYRSNPRRLFNLSDIRRMSPPTTANMAAIGDCLKRVAGSKRPDTLKAEEWP